MGKTAFAMQCVLSAMVADSSLRVCLANVEMPPERLLERQLSRLNDVPLDDIQNRSLSSAQGSQLCDAFEIIEDIAERLVFFRPPMTLTNVAEAADSIEAELIVLDYIQRIRPAVGLDDKRGSVDATMDMIRNFTNAGCGVVALSAVSRSKDSKGRSSYSADALSLASYRESSELEYGADDAYLLVSTDDLDDDPVIDVELRHLKSRYGQPVSVDLTFDRSRQRFAAGNQLPVSSLEKIRGLLGANDGEA